MNEATPYDGTGKMAEAIAALCGMSPKRQGQIAKLIRQAKDEMGIVGKAKVMPTDTKLAIWQWHYDRLQSTQSSVNIISQAEGGELVNIISQSESIEPVNIISQSESIEPVNIISQTDNDEPGGMNNLEVIRIAFYVDKDGKRPRQVIALDGFYINGLIAATGITRQDVPKWVQAATDSWRGFDAHLPITRQVKYLIVTAMNKAIKAKS